MEIPTFYHTTVLLQEAVDALAIKPNGVYVDATFGGGGHSREILSRLSKDGQLIAFDQDQEAWRNKPADERLIPVNENFRYLARFLRLHRHSKVDGILADLGVSSWQFDTAERGFSTRFDGPLDMRMDHRMELTATDVLATYSEERLHKMFELYGEVRNARQLAKHIVTQRSKGKIATIEGLKSMIAPVMKGPVNKYLAQLFQALRIEVNEELDVLKEFLTGAAQCLKPGGRLAIISFHSGEDRLVKQFMKAGTWEETMQHTLLPDKKAEKIFEIITKKPIEPTEAEINKNPRARSAKLRIAEKL